MTGGASLVAQAAQTVTAPSAPIIPANANLAAAKKAGEDFDAFFLSQVFKSMFDGVGTDALFGGGNAENIYRSLLIQQYAKVAAKTDTSGIGADVTREILRMQEEHGKK